MTRKTGSMKWSALAIATAIVIAPVAYSGGKLDSFVLRGGVSPAAQNAASQAPNDRFIISYRKGARSLSAASANNILANAARETGVGIEPLRTLATGASLIRTDRKLDRAATKRLMVALQNDPNVLAVEVDRLYQPLLVPNDPGYASQWHYQDGQGGINAQPAWDLSTG